MSRPLLLDLFCKAGGASVGYHRAGFDVVGIDIKPQLNYPFEFWQADALDVLDWLTTGRWQCYSRAEVAAIHASPPCQAWTAYRRRPGHVIQRPNLIPEVRELLKASGVPWVIENVPAAPLHHGVTLCGSMFELDIRRHRTFETSLAMLAPPCDHGNQARRFPSATNRTELRRTVEIGVWRIPLDVQQQAMGINWMTREELTEAIPPSYTEWIGTQLLAHLEAAA